MVSYVDPFQLAREHASFAHFQSSFDFRPSFLDWAAK